jgi:hypothetical protein
MEFTPNATLTINASASSGLPVALATDSLGVCSVVGNTVTVLSVGYCNIVASQAGNNNYNVAPQTIGGFEITFARQILIFTAPANQTFAPGLQVTLNATGGGSGNPIIFASMNDGVCTVSGTTATIVSAGLCTITANQAGNDNYDTAHQVSRSFTIAPGPQTITFAQPVSQTFASGKLVALPASASSGLPVTRTSLTLDVCTISGTSARLLGTGTCSIRVTQAGNGNFNSAAAVTRSFTVTAALSPEVSALAASARRHDQDFASLAPFGAGAVMAYASRSTATGPFGILRQNLSSTGAASGLAVIVAAPAVGVGEPDVAALMSGHVIVWQAPDGSGNGIFAQRFTATGVKAGSVFRVNATISGSQHRPRVAALPGGSFAVIWQTTINSSDDDVWMRVFTASGSPLSGDMRVNTTTARRQNNPDIAALATGTIAVTWASETAAGRFAVHHRLFRATGVPLTAQMTTMPLNQALNPTPVIAARTGSGAANSFAVAFSHSEVAGMATPADISVKIVSAGGTASISSVKANTIIAGHQASPTIAALKAGAFAVAFTTPDGSSNGIAIRLFSPAGTALGREERANVVVSGAQFAPAITPLGPAGATRGTTFLSSWTTRSTVPTDGNDIAARLFQGP